MAMAIRGGAVGGETRAGTAASKAAIGAGVVAGFIGGMVMGMMSMIHAAATGAGFFAPLKLIAATFYGSDALSGGAGPIVVGLMAHMMNSGILGLLFALVVGRRWSIGGALGLGLVWGVIIWAIMTWVVLPMADPTMHDAVLKSPGMWFMNHLVFGASLLLTPILARAFSGVSKVPGPGPARGPEGSAA